MANNRVEVHIGTKTSELKGMDDAEKIVLILPSKLKILQKG
ncbi:hypothetical protein ACKUZO_021645 [Acinetobacter baumannii]